MNLHIRTAKDRKHKSDSLTMFLKDVRQISPFLKQSLFVKYKNKVMLVKTSWKKGDYRDS